MQGTFGTTGVSAVFRTNKPFNLSLVNAGSTVVLKRCTDGTNFRTVESFTGDAERIVGEKTNEDVDYRLDCTAYVGAVSYVMKP